MTTFSNIAVLGVGRMGLPISRRLAQAGHHVTVFDPDPDRRSAAEDAGMTTAGTAEEAVTTAELVLTVLPGSQETSALLQSDGLMRALPVGVTWVDLTSTAPAVARRLAHTASTRGIATLDAPMGGGPDDAATGDLTLYVGGDTAVLQRCSSVLGELASTVHHVGGAGTGCLVKHLINLLWFGQAALTAEAALLAAATGIGTAQFLHLLQGGPAASRFLQRDFPRVLDGDYLPTFGLDRIVEELDTVSAEAADRMSPSIMIRAVAAAHQEALRGLGPVDAELAIVAHLEAIADTKLR